MKTKTVTKPLVNLALQFEFTSHIQIQQLFVAAAVCLQWNSHFQHSFREITLGS